MSYILNSSSAWEVVTITVEGYLPQHSKHNRGMLKKKSSAASNLVAAMCMHTSVAMHQLI